MTPAEAVFYGETVSVGAPGHVSRPSNHHLRETRFASSQHETVEGNTVRKSYPSESRNSRGESAPKISSHESTDTLVDFVKVQAIRYQQKELAKITGLSLKQVQNLRLGLSGVSGKTLTNWCKNCSTFAGEYAEYVGIIRPGDAEYAGAITQAFNAWQRRKA